MQFHSAVVALVLVGCATTNEIDTVYDPCTTLTLALDPDADAIERQAVEDAVSLWARVVPTQIEIGAGPQAVDVLPIEFVKGESYYRAIYWDAVGRISISRDRLAPEDYAIALAHEMGHAFGLLHVENTERASVMNIGNLVIEPNAEDAAAVIAQWSACQVR